MVEIDQILDDENLLELVEADLSKRSSHATKTGRNSTPVEVILRMIVLKHLRCLSYEKTIKNVSESLVLRQFCRVYFQPLPNKSTLIRWSNQISETTLKKLNQRLTQMAIELQLTKAQKMRTDGTVVATNIHFPSDNSLLVDGVRVMSRLLYKAKEILSSNSKIHPRLFQNRYRTARKISRNIDSLSQARSQLGRQNREQAYRRLLEVTQASLKQAQKVQVLLKDSTDLKAAKVGRALAIFIPRATQVIAQSSRRVLRQERVPAHEKLVSIFEAHTDIICRGKPNLSTEFGHKVWLDEVDGGLISNYRVLKGNPHDTQQWVESLDQHLQIFGRPPKQASADRGVYSHPNENYAQKLGVKQVILPKGGYKSKERDNFERKRNFQKGRRWHNGIEGRISVLKRCFGLERCLYKTSRGFERWVGWAIIAHNLASMSRNLSKTDKNA